MTDSPLLQVSPESLAELFNKDPELLTRDDQMKIVLALRAERARWLDNETKKKAAAKTPKRSASQLSLDDLGDLL